jgi:isopentenyl diphosphate isomerase/L-lactate dehydrogenase-like FMN-dependent dehydrogenase
MRGTDVVKGLALGATAVLIGKLETWGLSAGGEAGLERVVELLTTELRVTMGNIGADSLADIGPSTICPSVPPPPDVWPVGSAQLTPYL